MFAKRQRRTVATDQRQEKQEESLRKQIEERTNWLNARTQNSAELKVRVMVTQGPLVVVVVVVVVVTHCYQYT